MNQMVIAGATGLAIGLAIAWLIGTEGGEKALLVALAFAVGVFLVKSGTI